MKAGMDLAGDFISYYIIEYLILIKYMIYDLNLE